MSSELTIGNFANPRQHPVSYLLAMCDGNARILCICAKDAAAHEGAGEDAYRELAGNWIALSKLDASGWRELQTWRFVASIVNEFAKAPLHLEWRTVWDNVAAKLRKRGKCRPPGSSSTWGYEELKDNWRRLHGDSRPLPKLDAEDNRKLPKAQAKKRRRAASPRICPLTTKQTEAVQLVGEHKGNISAAAKAAGVSRQAMKKRYIAAMTKLGKAGVRKPKTQALPQDQRGQLNF